MAPAPSPQPATPNRSGLRFGQISELTVIVPLKAGKDGAERLRQMLAGGTFSGADAVGTVHDMRFVILDNDTKLLFATAYDGDWDSYITDFATKIPDAMDRFFSVVEGWPGIKSVRSRTSSPATRFRQPDGMSRTPTKRSPVYGPP